jgi:hypothetical protein
MAMRRLKNTPTQMRHRHHHPNRHLSHLNRHRQHIQSRQRKRYPALSMRQSQSKLSLKNERLPQPVQKRQLDFYV